MKNEIQKSIKELSGQPVAPNYITLAGVKEAIGGLTKREYFAGLCMQAFITNCTKEVDSDPMQYNFFHLSKHEVKFADALTMALSEPSVIGESNENNTQELEK